MNNDSPWPIYKGRDPEKQNKAVTPHDNITKLPGPPGWRKFEGLSSELVEREINPALPPQQEERGRKLLVNNDQIQMVNAAIFLRRPLLITGKPGTGKSSLAYSIARELRLGSVLTWPITTRTTLQEGLYSYDAIGRLQQTSIEKEVGRKEVPPIQRFLKLGPLGTALLPSSRPRVLLIDEIDKSDIDLPNNLLNIFEEGEFNIEELARLADEDKKTVPIRPIDPQQEGETVDIIGGKVKCSRFPVVIMTSNGEREFPPAFLRRCLRLEMPVPDETQLTDIVKSHFPDEDLTVVHALIKNFADQTKQRQSSFATDQLLNAIYLVFKGINIENQKLNDKKTLLDAIIRDLEGD